MPSVATMTRQRWIVLAAATAAAGGAAWLAKFAVIAVTDGATSGGAEAVTAVLYVLGVTLMALGSSWIGVTLAGDRHVALAFALGLLSPLLLFASFVLLDAVAQSVVGDAGPAWLQDEVGILATGAVWLGAGIARASDSLDPRSWRSRRPSTTR